MIKKLLKLIKFNPINTKSIYNFAEYDYGTNKGEI